MGGPFNDLTGGAIVDTTSTLGDTEGILSGGLSALDRLNPATLPLTLLLSILPALFGQNRGQRDMSDLIQYLKPSQPMYMSPNLPQMDKTTLNAVLNQFGRTKNWGWPSGA